MQSLDQDDDKSSVALSSSISMSEEEKKKQKQLSPKPKRKKYPKVQIKFGGASELIQKIRQDKPQKVSLKTTPVLS